MKKRTLETGNAQFNEYVARLQARHGEQFDPGQLSDAWASYFGPEWRVKVRFPCGTEKWGYVSGTTGWRPSLMLMRNARAHGSSWLLDDRCELIQARRS